MILITGGLGFIGSHFASKISQTENLVIVDNLSNSSTNIFNKLKKIAKKNIYFYDADIANFTKLQEIISTHKIHSIIHFAGLKSVGESFSFSAKYYYNNVVGSKILFDLIKRNNIQNLIFSSSATVYGKPIRLPLDENHPIRATNPYGQNKIDIENILKSDLYFKRDCSVKILRYFNPVGAHPSGLIGENPKRVPNNLMPYILKVAKDEYEKLCIFGNDYDTHDGSGVRDYIHIMDLVDGHMKALNYQKRGISTFNLGTGKGYSVLDLIKTFEQVNYVSIPFEISARRPGDVATVFANPTKAESVLGFKAKYSLEDMCRDAWKFAQNND